MWRRFWSAFWSAYWSARFPDLQAANDAALLALRRADVSTAQAKAAVMQARKVLQFRKAQ